MNHLDTIRELLTLYPEAKEDYAIAYREHISSLCKTEVEKAIVFRVLAEAIPEWSFRREMAHLQNTLWELKPTQETQQKREVHRRRVQIKYSPFMRFINKFL